MPATSETVDTLRLATAGSVDDGKSTLIGRLLYDAKSILADQLEHLAQVSHARNGNGHLDLALLTDGLRAEREQGITIDVAHRYFATPRRRFILADTPGHEQYTRNMVTGASTAEVAIVLVDARHGVVEQTRRHAAVAALLRVGHVVLAVNKMDLVDWSEEVFDRIVADFDCFASKVGLGAVTPLPMSALHGDNVVERSERLGWYAGPPLLEHLETVELPAGEPGELRFPVQWVLRGEERAYAGRVAGGELRPGAEVVALPSRRARAGDGGGDVRRRRSRRPRPASRCRCGSTASSTSRAGTCWRRRSRRPSRCGRSRPTSAGCRSGRCSAARSWH